MKTKLVLNLTTLLCAVFTANSRAQLPNAWQVTDNSDADAISYATYLSETNQMAATNNGFAFTINARFVTNFAAGAAGKAMTMFYDLGNRRFLVWWNLDGSGDLTAEPEGGSTYTLTTNGTGTALYHTHQIVYNPINGTASYLVDGLTLTNGWPSSATVLTNIGWVFWGSGSSLGRGQMNFHSINFEITGSGSVASYDAGTDGNPVAPDPITDGWTLTPTSLPPGTGVTNVSPDTAILPTAPSLAIAPAGAGFNSISWTPNRTNYVLQETAVLSSSNWTFSPSAATNPIVVPATLPTKFYRLIKP